MSKPFLLLNLCAIAALAVFALDPGLDLLVSAQFAAGAQGFPLAGLPTFRAVREVFRFAGNLIGVIGLILWIGSALIGPERRIPARIWGFAFALMAIGPGIVVNLIVKPLWGRARPANIMRFGGVHSFTPALEPARQCDWGCSFVSGEAAAATGLAIIVGVLIWPALGYRGRWGAAAILAAYAALVSGLRVAMGRHFLSDVVFGALLTGYTALWLYHAMRLAEAQPSLTAHNLRSDWRAFRRRLSRH